jgi:hypothetical protein
MALFFTDYSLGWLGLVDGCWKYILETGSRRSSLFDICKDPAESRNIAGMHEERIRRYRDRVESWIAKAPGELLIKP